MPPLACLQVSKHLREAALTHSSKAQLFIKAFAKALEVIPRQLCNNAGFDATDVLNKLRQKHALPDGSGKVRSSVIAWGAIRRGGGGGWRGEGGWRAGQGKAEARASHLTLPEPSAVNTVERDGKEQGVGLVDCGWARAVSLPSLLPLTSAVSCMHSARTRVLFFLKPRPLTSCTEPWRVKWAL